MNEQRAARGEELVINLGIGSPDGMPPMAAVEALCEAAVQPGNHAYQSYVGLPQLRQAFADWYAKWYKVQLDPAKEIQPLVGSKEAILLLSWIKVTRCLCQTQAILHIHLHRNWLRRRW